MNIENNNEVNNKEPNKNEPRFKQELEELDTDILYKKLAVARMQQYWKGKFQQSKNLSNYTLANGIGSGGVLIATLLKGSKVISGIMFTSMFASGWAYALSKNFEKDAENRLNDIKKQEDIIKITSHGVKEVKSMLDQLNQQNIEQQNNTSRGR